jgi:hypothetical protein
LVGLIFNHLHKEKMILKVMALEDFLFLREFLNRPFSMLLNAETMAAFLLLPTSIKNQVSKSGAAQNCVKKVWEQTRH